MRKALEGFLLWHVVGVCGVIWSDDNHRRIQTKSLRQWLQWGFQWGCDTDREKPAAFNCTNTSEPVHTGKICESLDRKCQCSYHCPSDCKHPR